MPQSCTRLQIRVRDDIMAERSQTSSHLLPRSAKSLQSNKDSRILWAKDDFLLTTGFDMMRGREVRLWDSRKLSSSLNTVSLGTSNGCSVYFSKHGCRGLEESGSVAGLQRGEEWKDGGRKRTEGVGVRAPLSDPAHPF
ncbi:hypothetical protein INR49_018142 [Caranx melampygus]|nr:hypothetical protein INR49_018142 [Caranx melampygus]